MDKEKVLNFLASFIDADVQVCDDGFVVCLKHTARHDSQKTSMKGIDLIFDEDGLFEGMKEC